MRCGSAADVDWKAARQNLALLNHYFWVRSSRTDRLRFLEHYRRHRRGPVEGHRPGGPADRGRDPALGRAALAALGPSLPVVQQVLRSPSRGDDAWGVASRELDPDAFRRIMDDPDSPFRRPRDHGCSRTRGRRASPRRP